LALTSPTGGGRSVGIVRSRTKATEFSLVYCVPYIVTSISGYQNPSLEPGIYDTETGEVSQRGSLLSAR